MARHVGLHADLAALWFEAPMVIGARMLALSPMALSSAKAQAEMTRMVVEKIAAAGESMIAMQFAIAGEMLKMASSVAPPPARQAFTRVAAKSVRPYARRVTANARRLAR